MLPSFDIDSPFAGQSNHSGVRPEQICRDVLRAIFEPFFALIEAVSGEQAVEIVEHAQVDLLVLDMNMDRLTGLETIRIVKRMDARMPCILVTSDASEDLRRQAKAADAWSVLSKPVRKTELLRTVSTAIGFRYDDPDVFATLGQMN